MAYRKALHYFGQCNGRRIPNANVFMCHAYGQGVIMRIEIIRLVRVFHSYCFFRIFNCYHNSENIKNV